MSDVHDRLAKAEPLYAMLPAIFRKCVDLGNWRYNIDTPFLAGDQCYATDGRILVWVAATEPIEKACADIPLDTNRKTFTRERIEVVASGTFATYPTPIPDLSTLPVCMNCKGTGRSWCECCEQPCPCNGCGGSGVKGNHAVALSPDVSIAAKFAKLLVAHSATVYLPEPSVKGAAIKFTLPDGTEGRLMPVTVAVQVEQPK